MEESTKDYSAIITEVIKKYNTQRGTNTSVPQITITLGKDRRHRYVIDGLPARDCRIIFDPLHVITDHLDINNIYICYTKEELVQLIDYMDANWSTFVDHNPNSEDIYDQEDIKIVSYTSKIDEITSSEDSIF